MKKETKKILLAIASIVFMVVILICSRNADLITRRFGIAFFGTILGVTLMAISLEIAADLEALKVEKWKAQRAARIHHYYEIDRDSFNAVAQKAIADGTMVSIIKEIDANEKKYNVEVRYETPEDKI